MVLCAKKQKQCIAGELRAGDCWIGLSLADSSGLILAARVGKHTDELIEALVVTTEGKTECKHWNGSILDEIDTVVKFAQTMTWKGVHPVVQLVTQTYQAGVKLTKQAMAEVETQIQRLTNLVVKGKELNLGKWFVDILYYPELETE